MSKGCSKQKFGRYIKDTEHRYAQKHKELMHMEIAEFICHRPNEIKRHEQTHLVHTREQISHLGQLGMPQRVTCYRRDKEYIAHYPDTGLKYGLQQNADKNRE